MGWTDQKFFRVVLWLTGMSVLMSALACSLSAITALKIETLLQ